MKPEFKATLQVVIIFIVVACFFSEGVTFAATGNLPPSTTALASSTPTAASSSAAALLKSWYEQLAALEAEIAALQATRATSTPDSTVTTAVTSCTPITLAHSLALGSSGSEVSSLQTFLKEQGYYTYSSITGYLGSVTEEAVAAFQRANGIDPVGIVGPITRAKISALTAACQIESNTSQAPPAPPVATNTPVIATATAATTTSAVPIPQLIATANTPGFGGGGDAPAPAPAIPTISSIEISAYGQTDITISWTTDVPSTSEVLYGTSTPYTASSSSSVLATSHSVALRDLSVGTDYHYAVQSLNSLGEATTSADQIFSTEGTTTLASLIPWGYIGMAVGDAGPNAEVDMLPSDAVYNAEFSDWVSENDGKWTDQTDPTGMIYNFSALDADIADFPGLAARYQNIVWGSVIPSQMTITSGNWQSLISGRVQTLAAHYSNFSPFFSVDANNEPFDGAYSNGLTPNAWYDAGGMEWWTAPFEDLQAVVSTSTRLIINNYSIGENSYNWGGDPAPYPDKYAAQPDDKVAFDRMIYEMQNALENGVRIDGVGFELHLSPNDMISENDLRWDLIDLHRLDLTPEITEANVRTDTYVVSGFGLVPNSNAAQVYAAHYLGRLLYDFITYGGVTDITFWTNSPNQPGAIEETLYDYNQKTPLYYEVASVLAATPEPDPSTIPIARRLNFTSSVPPTASTTNSAITEGTQGEIDIPWSAYVYRTGGVMYPFSQNAWTVDFQFYTLENSAGNLFQAVDASGTPLFTIGRDSGTGNVSVTIGTSSPIILGAASSNTYNALVLSKDGSNFEASLNGSTTQSTTSSIGDIATLSWLANSTSTASDAALTTLDVYESQSLIWGSAEVQALSVFQNSEVLTYSEISNWSPP